MVSEGLGNLKLTAMRHQEQRSDKSEEKKNFLTQILKKESPRRKKRCIDQSKR
jgi:hypothetical protein